MNTVRCTQQAEANSALRVVDPFTRECLALEVGTGVGSRRMTRVLAFAQPGKVFIAHRIHLVQKSPVRSVMPRRMTKTNAMRTCFRAELVSSYTALAFFLVAIARISCHDGNGHS